MNHINDVETTGKNDNKIRAFFDTDNLNCLVLVDNTEGDLISEYHIEFLDNESRIRFGDALAELEAVTEETVELTLFEYPYHHFTINGDLVDDEGHLYNGLAH